MQLWLQKRKNVEVANVATQVIYSSVFDEAIAINITKEIAELYSS